MPATSNLKSFADIIIHCAKFPRSWHEVHRPQALNFFHRHQHHPIIRTACRLLGAVVDITASRCQYLSFPVLIVNSSAAAPSLSPVAASSRARLAHHGNAHSAVLCTPSHHSLYCTIKEKAIDYCELQLSALAFRRFVLHSFPLSLHLLAGLPPNDTTQVTA